MNSKWQRTFRPVGEAFDFEDKKLIAVKCYDCIPECTKCFFDGTGHCSIHAIGRITPAPECMGIHREDKISVYFKEIPER